MLPFYPQANALAEAGRFSYDADDALGSAAAPMIRGFDSPLVRTNGLERFSCPTDFGQRYARRLQVAPDVKVLLGANCTAVRLERRRPGRARTGSRHAGRPALSRRAAGDRAGSRRAGKRATAAGIARRRAGGRRQRTRRGGPLLHVPYRRQCGHAGAQRPAARGPPRLRDHARGRLLPAAAGDRRNPNSAGAAWRNAVARLHFPRITDPRHRNGVLSGLFLSRGLISYEYGKRLNDGTPHFVRPPMRATAQCHGGPDRYVRLPGALDRAAHAGAAQVPFGDPAQPHEPVQPGVAWRTAARARKPRDPLRQGPTRSACRNCASTGATARTTSNRCGARST